MPESFKRTRPGRLPKARRLPARVGHRVVAGVAIEQHELGKQAVAPALRVEQDVHLRLATATACPIAQISHAVPIALALQPVGVDLEVRRLQSGEGVQLEAHARVAGGHDAMADVLVARCRSGTTGTAGRAPRGPSSGTGRAHVLPAWLAPASTWRRSSARAGPWQASQPMPSANPNRSPRAPRGLCAWQSRHILASCAGWVRPELAGDALRRSFEQQLVGARMLVDARPGDVFVLQDIASPSRRRSIRGTGCWRSSPRPASVARLVGQRLAGRTGQGRRSDRCRPARQGRFAGSFRSLALCGSASSPTCQSGLPVSAPSRPCRRGAGTTGASPRALNGREPRRPNTAIWPPVSSTARSRSSPLDSASAGERVSRQAISCGFGSGLKAVELGLAVGRGELQHLQAVPPSAT